MIVSWDSSELGNLAAIFDAAAAMAPVRTGQVLRDVGGRIQNTMIALAPVDTATLQGSITMDVHGPLMVEVGPTVDYAIYPEWGTATQPPQRFAARAVEAHEGELQTAMEDMATGLFW